MTRWLRRLVLLGIVAFAVQLVPWGWRHSDPPVRADAPWPDAQVASIARASCHARHGNETDWPLYSDVAPASWLVRRDVDSGPDELNFPEWGEEGDADDAAVDRSGSADLELDRQAATAAGAVARASAIALQGSSG